MRFCLLVSLLTAAALAGEVIPHAQSTLPGPALTPQEAMAKMKLAPGFSVTCVASEPDIVNPTSFTFDERGRIWITESVEYPRHSAGKGKDCVKVLEDVDHDGKYEKVTVFKDGLNIPCGVVMGNGGVYVTNSPDILFLKDTNGDDVADTEEVILTGFGRDDRHELPNSLIWGPDGWLYGMNGVFNGSSVKFDGKTYNFTCAIWRYHPKWKKFELFAEGTSNPWGLDYNLQGDWFLSCCVIDHLFHMTQSGYYLRQGGPYPSFTRRLPSVTTEKHQQAAYAGLCIYYGDAYPKEYYGTLLMGNLHGSCINQDLLTRKGSTYVQKNGPDFLSANDKWFMPVAQKVGPDGCVYIMDWYDRYHCYQDANRDAPGLDRTRGRIYRIAHNNTPLAKPFDLKKLTDDELVKMLGHSNSWQRREAQRLLNERMAIIEEMQLETILKLADGMKGIDEGLPVPDDLKAKDNRWLEYIALETKLKKLALLNDDKTESHVHALWLMCSRMGLHKKYHLELLSHPDPKKRSWGARALGRFGIVSAPIYEKLLALANDPSPDVRVQIPIAAGRLVEKKGARGSKNDTLAVLFACLKFTENAKDPLIPTIIYNNLKPLAVARMDEIRAFFDANPDVETAYSSSVTPWIAEVINAERSKNPALLAADIKKVVTAANPNPAKVAGALKVAIVGYAAASIKSSERGKHFDDATRTAIARFAAEKSEAQIPATIVALWWGEKDALSFAITTAVNPDADTAERAQLLRAITEAPDNGRAGGVCATVAFDEKTPLSLRKDALSYCSAFPIDTNDFLGRFRTLPPELRPLAVNALVRAPGPAAALLNAVDAKLISATDINTNHVRQILALNDGPLTARVKASWGEVKTERDPERVEVIKKMRDGLKGKRGSVSNGSRVFEAKCQQCHSIYGKGNDVGPDLTGAGRENLDAILANVLDPNLVIGKPYFVNVAKTNDGKIVTGILVEDSPERIALKREGNVVETIARADLKDLKVQSISLMPEGLEKNMTEQEFADLVEFMLTREAPKK